MSQHKYSVYSTLTMLIAAIFMIQSCGPQLMGPNPSNDWSNYEKEALTPDNISLALCFGEDSDDDGVCDDEEEPECIDDPYCEDDEDIILDGLNGDYKNGGAVGRWLTGIGIAAGAVGLGFGLVGASGLVKKKGEQKWGWLHNLLKDKPDQDGVGFLRLLDKNGGSVQKDLLTLETDDEELFYTKMIDGVETPWLAQFREIKLENENFAVLIAGKNHGTGGVFGKNTKVLEAGKHLVSCIAGKKSFSPIEPNATITIDGEAAKFYRARITVQMKKEYTQVRRETHTLDSFQTMCKNTDNGGIYIALQLKDGSYFVNALPTTMLSKAGVETIGNDSNYPLGYQVDYLLRLRQGGPPSAPVAIPLDDIDNETVFTYHHYNVNGYAASRDFQFKLFNNTQVDEYNNLDTAQNRAKYLLGFAENSDVEAKPAKKEIADNTSSIDERSAEENEVDQQVMNGIETKVRKAQITEKEVLDENGQPINQTTIHNFTINNYFGNNGE